MKVYKKIFDEVVAAEHLFTAWDEFRKGKGNKRDILRFELQLEQNIFQLHRELLSRRYRHGPYHGFHIADPKPRHIHKATVRDRVIHHAVFKVLNRVFDPTFIADSFSCRIGKGTHKGVARVQSIIRKVSKNGTQSCYALKCDIKKFFDTVDHDTLFAILKRRIKDPDFLWLLEEVIESYSVPIRERERERVNALPRVGIPIGNLTSQIFANIYMNEFDQCVKHELLIKNYARYTDDFVIISDSRLYLEQLVPVIMEVLRDRLKLSLHPKKITIQPRHRGVDFLGYIIFPHYRLVRTGTRQRILKKLKQRAQERNRGLRSDQSLHQTLQSYLGVLSHANSYKLGRRLKNQLWFWMSEQDRLMSRVKNDLNERGDPPSP